VKLLILRSARLDDRYDDAPYCDDFNTVYAQRVIDNLESRPGSCTACGPDCVSCRSAVGLSPDDSIDVLDLPARLPHVLESPAAMVPDNVPQHDVLLVICVHEQILLETLKLAAEYGTKAVVVPIEAPGWVSSATRTEAQAICEQAGIEIAFPKPFCAFDPPAGSVLAEFRNRFHIGRPDVKLTTSDGIITNAEVHTSAACGATYCIARWLRDRAVDDNLEIEVVAKRFSGYPCTASMEWDDELNDTIMHIAGHAHFDILSQVKPVAALQDEMVDSPMGRKLIKPIPPEENLQNIDRARQLILDAITEQGALPLAALRNLKGVSPAAANSALILLKQKGVVRIEAGAIVAA
jgi:hypothetical protein